MVHELYARARARPSSPRSAIAAIIAEDIEGGQFRPQDPHRAAADVVACFGSLHEVVSAPEAVPEAIDELNGFVLGGLDYDGEVPS
jgi:hypothetical protein